MTPTLKLITLKTHNPNTNTVGKMIHKVEKIGGGWVLSRIHCMLVIRLNKVKSQHYDPHIQTDKLQLFFMACIYYMVCVGFGSFLVSVDAWKGRCLQLHGFLPFLRSDCPSPEKAMNLLRSSSSMVLLG